MNYIICTSQRSGKTWLCRILKLLRVGHPEEYFTRLHRAKDFEIKKAFLEKGIYGACRSLVESQGPVVGLAIQWNQLSWLARSVGSSVEKAFEEVRSNLEDARVFYLKRDDILGQAISLFLKNESGYTTSSDTSELKKNRERVEFDAEKLAWCYLHTLESYLNWENLLADLNVEYRQISYELLCENVVTEVQNVLKFIDVSRSAEEILECSACLSIIRNNKDEQIRCQALGDKRFLSLISKGARN